MNQCTQEPDPNKYVWVQCANKQNIFLCQGNSITNSPLFTGMFIFHEITCFLNSLPQNQFYRLIK